MTRVQLADHVSADHATGSLTAPAVDRRGREWLLADVAPGSDPDELDCDGVLLDLEVS